MWDLFILYFRIAFFSCFLYKYYLWQCYRFLKTCAHEEFCSPAKQRNSIWRRRRSCLFQTEAFKATRTLFQLQSQILDSDWLGRKLRCQFEDCVLTQHSWGKMALAWMLDFTHVRLCLVVKSILHGRWKCCLNSHVCLHNLHNSIVRGLLSFLLVYQSWERDKKNFM